MPHFSGGAEHAAVAVVLLMPAAQGQGALSGPTLARVSTFAGNLLIVGSIANIIVVDAWRPL